MSVDHRIERRTALGLAGAGAIAAAAGAGHAYARRSSHPLTSETVQIGHLLRRAGFAPTTAELAEAVAAGASETLRRVLHPESVDDSVINAQLAAQTVDFHTIRDVRRRWLLRMAGTRRPLVEKMTLFWHGLLTSDYRKIGGGALLVQFQNELLRARCLGSLRELLMGISTDRAMLRFLDGDNSQRAKPNENYAREFMELFTMGLGHFTQGDVVAASRALTGWYVTGYGPQGGVGFRPGYHDPGVKTFLGHTGNLGLSDVVDIVLAHPATPRYLARRMWTFFAYPDPSEADLGPVIDAYHASHGTIAAMVEAVFRSPAFFSPRAYRALVKSPVELVVGLARQLSLPIDDSAALGAEDMGQGLFAPPSVAGWPGGPAWLSTGAWMARLRYLLARTGQPDLHVPAATGLAPGAAPGQLVDGLLALMVDGQVSSAARSALDEHAAQPVGGPALAAELAFLVVATPEYQLA